MKRFLTFLNGIGSIGALFAAIAALAASRSLPEPLLLSGSACLKCSSSA